MDPHETSEPSPQPGAAAPDNPKRLKSWIWNNTDPLTKWLQVIALVAAAGWTFYTFRGLEAGSLEKTVGLGIDLRPAWRTDSSPPSCWALLTVDVNNVGVRSFDIAKLSLQVRRIDLPDRTTGSSSFLDMWKLEHDNPPFYDLTPNSALIRHFSPKAELHDGFTLIFYGRPQPGLYIFRAEIFDESGKSIAFGRFWTDRLCQ
jgi:hypothetical protein